MKSQQRSRRVMVIGVSALLITVVSVLLTPPASSYESSLFHAYHPVTWVAFAVAFACFLLSILTSHYRTRAITGIGTLYAVFLSLPAVRSYSVFATPRSDILFHVSIISDILSTGTIPYLFYPAPHTLFSVVFLLTGLPRFVLQPISGIVFTGVLIVGIVIAARRFLPSTAWPFVLVAALPPMYGIHHISFHPWFFGLTFIPLLLFLAIKSERTRPWALSILVLTIGSALIFYHVLTAALAVVIVFTTVLLLSWISQKSSPALNFAAPVAVATMLGVWVVYLDRFAILVRRTFIAQLAPGGGISYATQAGSTERTVWQLIELVFTQWGSAILYGGLGGVIVLGLALYFWAANIYRFEQVVSLGYGVGFLFGVSLAIAQIFARNPLRILQFALLFSVFLIGIALWRLQGRVNTVSARSIIPDRGRTALAASVFACILVTGLLGGIALYPDHQHLTETTVEGATWHLDHHDRSQPTASQQMSHNIELYIHGYTEGRASERVFNRHNPELQLPTQLGYTTHTTAGEWADGYLLTKHEDLVQAADIPENRKDTVDHYTAQDEAHLVSDSTVNRIYTNGKFRTWQTR